MKITHKSEGRDQNPEEAAQKAIDFLSLRQVLTEENKEKIREYYRNSSINGMYHTQSEIYKAMMIWSALENGIV